MDWIKITDKMPPKNTDVIMVTSSRIIVIGDRYNGIWRVPGQTFWKDGELHSYLDDNDILYWMPLPELPCDGKPETTSENSLHKHFVSGSLHVPKISEKWLQKYIKSKLEKDSYNKKEITQMLAYVFEQAYKQTNSNDR